MRIRAFAYLLVGMTALVLAWGTFTDAIYFGWRTVAPMGTGQRGRSRHPTPDEARAFAAKGNRQFGYSAVLGAASLGLLGAFAYECVRGEKRRRRAAVEQAVAPDDPAAPTS